MAKITCMPNGPFIVEGPVELLDASGRPFDTGGRAKVALCRCGLARNKPLCDGAHRAAGFQADDCAARKG